jgi:hypothetical protein
VTAEEFRSLLDRKIRRQLAMYATFGYVGVVIGEALAYIALLEEELEKREGG